MADTAKYEQLPNGWSVPNREGLLALIRRFSIWGLGGEDGCRCCHFEVLGFGVDVSCRKSSHTVRVYSDYLFRDAADLPPLAEEVLRQLAGAADGYAVRFCEYSQDHPAKCCYCGEPRHDKTEYLCEGCRMKPEALAQYPALLREWNEHRTLIIATAQGPAQ